MEAMSGGCGHVWGDFKVVTCTRRGGGVTSCLGALGQPMAFTSHCRWGVSDISAHPRPRHASSASVPNATGCGGWRGPASVWERTAPSS